MMATITITDNSPQAKKFLAYARTLPFAKVKRERKAKIEEDDDEPFDVYKSLEGAFADVRLMLDGKKKKKTAQQFLEELLMEELDRV